MREVQAALHRHPRRIATGVLIGLGGFAVTAFGIAPLAPDAADLPRRVVQHAVEPSDLSGQVDLLASHDLQLSRSDLTRSSDTADTLLRRLGVSDPEVARFLRSDPLASQLLQGRAGKMVTARAGAYGRMSELVARFPASGARSATHFERLRIASVDGRWRAETETVPLVATVRLASGTIRSSLFAATDESGLPDAIAVQMAEMFGTEIDFHRELRKGDTFSVVYEALTADGEPVAWGPGTGRVLAAEFVNDGRVLQSVWFAEAGGGKGGYFDLKGRSTRRTFLASPMEFSRVTSGFAMRFHPILKTWRRHLGVDYGAPTGTPVRSVGDGTVAFAGRQGGYGNAVAIRHDAKNTTFYAHLSRIDVRVGQRIEQGQRIGAVGATGWATGPHLHFEFRVDGEHQDPLKIARASQTLSIGAEERQRFAEVAAAARSQLGVAQSLGGRHFAME